MQLYAALFPPQIHEARAHQLTCSSNTVAQGRAVSPCFGGNDQPRRVLERTKATQGHVNKAERSA